MRFLVALAWLITLPKILWRTLTDPLGPPAPRPEWHVYRPSLEGLERRDTPSASLFPGGVLLVQGSPGNDLQQLVPVVAAAPAQVRFDERLAGGPQTASLFPAAAVKAVVWLGDAGDDNFSSTLNVPHYLFGQAGNDQIYSIVGLTAVDGGAGSDRIIVNAPKLGYLAYDPADVTPVIFGQTTQRVALIGRELYFATDNTGDVVSLAEYGGYLFASFKDGSGTTTQAFLRSAVDGAAAIFGSGADTLVNASSIDTVAYGSAGNDVLIGGAGFNLLKGGSGNDILVGGRGVRNDLSGDAGSDILVAGTPRDTIRSDAADAVFAQFGNAQLSLALTAAQRTS